MGAHFARQLLDAGAQVAVGDVNETALGELSDRIHARTLDVTAEADCQAFVGWASEKMGGLNALINNAGIIKDALLVKKNRETGELIKLSAEDWRAVIDVNLSGATYMAREVAARMIETESRPGVIVNMSSLGRHGNRGQTNYVATKAALAANTVTWGLELSRFGIRVGAVAPGMIETGMTKGMNQKAKEKLVSMVPAGRVGQPEDIWLAVKFIIECDYFTCRTIDVDGGLTMK
jgi:3-oxoacyl-[acyl-carrier protein] reductase